MLFDFEEIKNKVNVTKWYGTEAWYDILNAIADCEDKSRPQGKWLLSDLQSQADNDNGNYLYVCTNCNHTDIHAKTQKVPYCWWCGAKMKGAEE